MNKPKLVPVETHGGASLLFKSLLCGIEFALILNILKIITYSLHLNGNMMPIYPLHILVTDLNHHVRNLLQRELTKAGHIIYTASNIKEAHEALYGPNPLDMIILDPEIFEIFGESFFIQFREKMPHAIIIFHTFSEFIPTNEFIPTDEFIPTNKFIPIGEIVHGKNKKEKILFIEKNEKSIHSLKTIIQAHVKQ